jgi:Protein of unknown function (DUF4241)
MDKDYDHLFHSNGRILTIGTLHLPTGRIVACDPFFAGIALPFGRAVRPGAYAAQICLVTLPPYGERVALARILFQPEGRSTRFEEALKEFADAGRYYVEAGLGSFMDEMTRQRFAEVMARFYQERPEGNYYDDVLAAELKKSAVNPEDPRDVGSWNLHVLPGSDLNIAMFASGLGDGAYSSYWGLDDASQVVSLTTDFGIL